MKTIEKITLIKEISGAKCTRCEGELIIGHISIDDPTYVILCTYCSLKIVILLVDITISK